MRVFGSADIGRMTGRFIPFAGLPMVWRTERMMLSDWQVAYLMA